MIPVYVERHLNTHSLQSQKHGNLNQNLRYSLHPETLKHYFKEMTQIFKNVDVAVKDCGLYMAKFVKEDKVTKPTQ